jgi:hypothetical protein
MGRAPKYQTAEEKREFGLRAGRERRARIKAEEDTLLRLHFGERGQNSSGQQRRAFLEQAKVQLSVRSGKLRHCIPVNLKM